MTASKVNMANNLAEQLGNLKIEEPKFEKWNELPPEIKLETIKKLDFKTRCSLRSTCHLEKSLVDSQKFRIDQVSLRASNVSTTMRLSNKKPKIYLEKVYRIKEVNPSFQYFMEHAVIENLQFLIGGCFHPLRQPVDITDKISPLPWTVKCLRSQPANMKNLIFCLERLNEKVEKIIIHTSPKNGLSFDNVYTIPKLATVPYLEIVHMRQPKLPCIHKLAKIWIKNEAKVGQQFSLTLFCDSTEAVQAFREEFSSRIVSNKEQMMRIRTDNQSKHILLQIVTPQARMTVIPADMKETEYDTKW